MDKYYGFSRWNTSGYLSSNARASKYNSKNRFTRDLSTPWAKFRAARESAVSTTSGLLGLQTHSTAYELSRHLLLPTTWSPTWKGLVAGTIASSSSQIVNVPVDVVSQKLMMAGQSKNLNISLRNVIVEIYSKNGLRGFYFISLLTFGPMSGIWWSTYLTVHDYLLPNFPTALNAFSRMCAGFTSSTLTNPLDVIRTLRTRFQVIGGKSIGNIARRLYKEKGLAMLYKGLTARYMSTLPSSALYIAMYELVKNLQAYVYSK